MRKRTIILATVGVVAIATAVAANEQQAYQTPFCAPTVEALLALPALHDAQGPKVTEHMVIGDARQFRIHWRTSTPHDVTLDETGDEACFREFVDVGPQES